MSALTYSDEKFKKLIKNVLKENLKTKTYIHFPAALSDGYVQTDVYFDDEVISSEKTTLRSGSTLFAF